MRTLKGSKIEGWTPLDSYSNSDQERGWNIVEILDG